MVKISNLLIALFVVLGVLFAGCNNTSQNTTADTNTIMQKENATKSDAQISQEKLAEIIADGIYSKDIEYNSPAGLDKIKLNFEVKEGKFTSFAIENVKVAEVSENFNKGFNAEIQNLVIGKSVSEVKTPVIVAGASLTTKAVSDKLNELKTN